MPSTETLPRHATLSDSDIDAIEAQMNADSPIYLPTLIRELRKSRAELTLARKVAGRMAEYLAAVDGGTR